MGIKQDLAKYAASPKGRAVHKRYADKTYLKSRALMEQAKADRGNRCEECGVVFHPCQLDFAHMDEHRASKNEYLMRRSKGGPKSMMALAHRFPAEFLAEIKMCRLICSNCHRLETWQGKHYVPIGPPSEEATEAQIKLFTD